MKSSPQSRAFTLIELLVVIAIIGVLAGSIGLALRSGDRAPALQSAQALLNGFVSSARAQAALESTDATLVIWADRDDPETYLRRAAIVVKVDTGGTTDPDAYQIKGTPVDLPRGIFFVPEGSGSLPARLETPALWTDLTLTEYQSTGSGVVDASGVKAIKRFEESSSPQWQNDPDAPTKYYESIAFNAYGKLVSTKSGNPNDAISYLAVAPGEIQAGPVTADRGVLFQSSEALRGLKLSTYGIPIMLNEKSAFIDTN